MTAQREPAARRPAARVGVSDGTDESDTLCSCCEPKNPLVMRPDFGVLGDGSAEFALCVLHEPNPVVYRNRGDGTYVQAAGLSLNAAGEIVDAAGRVVARVAGESFQRLSTVDDDDAPGPSGGGPSGPRDPQPGGAARPAAFHVDLSQDDFYARATSSSERARTR